MAEIKIGQILWLRIRFNNMGNISNIKHPYLIADINDEYKSVEVIQLDSLKGKEYKATFKSNKAIFNKNPEEVVIFEDSFAQLDNKFILENKDLDKYRKTEELLSEEKLKKVLKAYFTYQENNEIDEMKIVYLDKQELDSLN